LQHTEHRTVGSDNANFGDSNAVIDANLETALLLARIKARATHRHWLTVTSWNETIEMSPAMGGGEPESKEKPLRAKRGG